MNRGAGAGAGAGYSSSDDDGGYGAGKEVDARISFYPPLWWLVLTHLLVVGYPEGGKTTWLLTFLMWATNEFALRQYYSEVIIICAHAGPGYNKKGEDAYHWCLFRWLYQITSKGGEDRSPQQQPRRFTAGDTFQHD